jgi:hypothetical protein
VVLDVTGAPRLANAIGYHVYRTRSAADKRCENARAFLTAQAPYIHVVPVDGPNEHFALPFVLADGVRVNARTGEIRSKGGA